MTINEIREALASAQFCLENATQVADVLTDHSEEFMWDRLDTEIEMVQKYLGLIQRRDNTASHEED